MLTADPPAHTRYRKLGGKAFTYKRVEQMGDYVAKVTNDLIDTFIDDGACEFKSAFANHLPMTVIADCAGRAAPRHGSLPPLVGRLHRPVRRRLRPRDPPRSGAAHRRVPALFRRSHRGEAAHPTEDVISDLVHADLADEGDPRKMDHGELLSILQQLLVAGNETTAHSLTAGMYYLISNPDQLERVKQ